MSWRTLRALLVMLTLAAASPAFALKFRALENGALLVYDCGRIGLAEEKDPERDCKRWESMIAGPSKDRAGRTLYPGDAAMLANLLNSNRKITRVLLASGGGNLDEGVKLGRLLRQHRKWVEVPEGADCISACTVAFLGGVIRDVHPKATYQVHAYSGLSSGSVPFEDIIERYKQVRLEGLSAEESRDGREWAQKLLIYVQEMIGGAPDVAGIDRALGPESGYFEHYRRSGRLEKDEQRLRKEGPINLREIMMTVERGAAEFYFARLAKAGDSLGARAPQALKILDAMFSSRISDTYSMSQTALTEMGYINVRR